MYLALTATLLNCFAHHLVFTDHLPRARNQAPYQRDKSEQIDQVPTVSKLIKFPVKNEAYILV